MTLKRIIRLSIKVLGVFILLIALYLVSAIGLSAITVNSNVEQCERDSVEIYIKTNGVHLDFVLPLQNQYKDWSKFVNPADTKSGNHLANYVAFGWGDRGFYLQTETWGDLKFSVALNALFFVSSSAMHVTFYNRIQETESCRKICISSENYRELVKYISESFHLNTLGLPQKIEGAAYWDNDLFYEAKGSYSLFYTCNTWTNSGLKAANLKACLWTPFDYTILGKYAV